MGWKCYQRQTSFQVAYIHLLFDACPLTRPSDLPREVPLQGNVVEGPCSTGLTETNDKPKSRTFLSKPCNAA